MRRLTYRTLDRSLQRFCATTSTFHHRNAGVQFLDHKVLRAGLTRRCLDVAYLSYLLGQLVCFFPTNVFVDHKVKADEARSNLPTSEATQRPIRVSEAFGKVQARTEDSGYQETDEALQMASAHSLRIVSTKPSWRGRELTDTHALRRLDSLPNQRRWRLLKQTRLRLSAQSSTSRMCLT